MNEEIRTSEYIENNPTFFSNKDKLFGIKNCIEISNDRIEPDIIYLDESCWNI